ncbi:ferritin-like domain-containing protein [Muricoccus aerilatus]|uniref:ferritin-like domain-containing protein n=1 Tax=Muricoccus aerilatus TaxID=452982 RepID=UPI000A593DB3|nr:ferritin-like domain-containing protein [Roseomonas aerilata]
MPSSSSASPPAGRPDAPPFDLVPTDRASVAAADHEARNWTFDKPGPVRVGSRDHMVMFARMLLETHNPYKPRVLDWPKLDPEAHARLTSLPIWDIAVQTEGRASLRVLDYAATITDPLLHEAMVMDGNEEARHKKVLSNLVEAYGVVLEPEPEYKGFRDVEWGWMRTGYSECIDSFFAFGLFEAARRSGYFPPDLVDTFEPVIQEEARHILFFANWAAWARAQQPWWRKPYFLAKTAAVWAVLIWDRLVMARDMGSASKDTNFTATSGSIGVTMTAAEMIDICLAEDRRRMAGYDPRLLRPTTVPFVIRLARRFMGKAKPATEPARA